MWFQQISGKRESCIIEWKEPLCVQRPQTVVMQWRDPVCVLLPVYPIFREYNWKNSWICADETSQVITYEGNWAMTYICADA